MKSVNPTSQIINTVSSNSRDLDQDAKISLLQSSVTALNTAVGALQLLVNELSGSIDDKYTAQTNALENKITLAINGLKGELGETLTTENVVADNIDGGIINGTHKGTADLDSLEAEEGSLAELNAVLANVATLNVTDKANVEEAVINLANIVEAIIGTLSIEELEASGITADIAGLKKSVIEEATIDRLNAEVITVSDEDPWKEPVGNPDNTELLRLRIPNYKGTVNIVSQDNKINITVINGTYISFNQSEALIYRVDFEEIESEKGASIYLVNGFNYKEIRIGQKDYDSTYSEIVDRTDYERNVITLEGIFLSGDIVTPEGQDVQLSVKVEQSLPESLLPNTIYLVQGEKSYYTNRDSIAFPMGPSIESAEVGILEEGYDEFEWKQQHYYIAGFKSRVSGVLGILVYYYSSTGTLTQYELKNDGWKSTYLPSVTCYKLTKAVKKLAIESFEKSIDFTALSNDYNSFKNSKGQASGLATLDTEGHVPLTQLPTSALVFKGNFDASEGYPATTGLRKGDFYICNGAGTIEGVEYNIGDWAIYNGTAFEISLNSNSVVSVNNKKGVVTLNASDVGATTESEVDTKLEAYTKDADTLSTIDSSSNKPVNSSGVIAYCSNNYAKKTYIRETLTYNSVSFDFYIFEDKIVCKSNSNFSTSTTLSAWTDIGTLSVVSSAYRYFTLMMFDGTDLKLRLRNGKVSIRAGTYSGYIEDEDVIYLI